MDGVQKLLGQLPHWQDLVPEAAHKVISKIERCHTAAMGYHAYRCSDASCKHVHIQYHGCRNRHCPHCGSHRARQWMEERLNELLPVKYFHVVFTLPSELKGLAYINRRKIFGLLFDSSSHCLLTLGKDEKYLGATPGISSVLHTWGQQLNFHPHVHCIVSGGGADKQNRWKDLKKGSGRFLFPYAVMEPLYKGFFMEKLDRLVKDGKVKLPDNCNWKQLRDTLYRKKWIVHAKQPMGNAGQVIEYLGRYTQKIAISKHRIKSIDAENRVSFWYKDYRDGGKRKLTSLSGGEFLRRFAQHILPPRFVRIRHYGIMGNYRRKERIDKILEQMEVPQHPEKEKVPKAIELLCMYGESEMTCPKCKRGKLLLIEVRLPYSRAGPLESQPKHLRDVQQ